MCWGSDDDDRPQFSQISAPPPPPEIMDVIDEVSGVEFVTVKDSQGKSRRIKRYLPKTPEQQERTKLGETIVSQAMKNILELRKYDIDAIIPFQPIIDIFSQINRETAEGLQQIANIGNIQEDKQKFQEMSSAILERDIQRNRRNIDENFIHRGISDSTTANEYRAALASEENLARQRVNVDSSLYAENLAAKRLETNSRAFGLQQIGRDQRLKEAQTQYQLLKDQQGDLERRRHNAIEENKSMVGLGSAILGEDVKKALASDAPQIANQTFAMQSADSLNRYAADVNRQRANHEMALNDYNSRPQSFGDWALQTGSTLGTSMFTAAPGSMAHRLGNKLF